jgi:bifunctional non-homologous end joining protein LigD
MARRQTSSRRQYQSGVGPRGFIAPQLCKVVDEAPSGERWVHEVKFDGYRMQMHVRAGEATFYSRNGLDWTERFPEISRSCARLDSCILDGEVCAPGKDDLPDFANLLAALSAGETSGLVYYVFDILAAKGDDLRGYPLETRKNVLAAELKSLKRGDRGRVSYVDHQRGDGPAVHRAACRMKLEGIVSKMFDSPYKTGDRSGIWQKVKCRLEQEVVVGGWTSEGSRFRSLLLGAWRNGKFIHIGHVGTGFNQRNLPGLKALLEARASKTRPFQNPGEPKASRDTHWVEPTLVVQVAFTSWTRDAKLRQASFKGVREDKDAREVVIEQA